MRTMMLGDVVGRAGRRVVLDHLPRLVDELGLDFVVVNGENAAGGFGITEPIFREIIDAGADVITTGNHAWDQREALVFIEREPQLLRPANFPAGTPGRGANLFIARNGARVMVVNAMGRVFMDALDDPFASVASALESCALGEEADLVIVDFHAEATSEKQAMAHFLDGRATVVAGTHTHVPTADHRVLPGGTAYVSDLGMCGDYDSVLGMEKDEPLRRFLTKVPSARFAPAVGAATLSGIVVDSDDRSGLATRISPIRIGGHLAECLPDSTS
ncbi:MAG: TIGR00282 family metallophosphoesterase [Hyphomicrobiales bacterium]